MCDGSMRPIEEVEAGDRVLSRDAETGEVDCPEVRNRYSEHKPVAEVTLESDDGGLSQVVRRAASVYVLHRTEKAGLEPAYLAGFDWALERDYDAILEMDADFSHQPKYLPEMISQLEDDDVVVGSRYVEGGGTEDWGMLRKVISRGGGIYARTILGFDVQDPTAGFVAWRREVLEGLDLRNVSASGYVFQIEMKYRAHKAGYSICEIPITFPDRVAGESKMTADIALEAVTKLWAIRMKV